MNEKSDNKGPELKGDYSPELKGGYNLPSQPKTPSIIKKTPPPPPPPKKKS